MKANELMIGDFVLYRNESIMVWEIDEYYDRINTEPDGYNAIRCIEVSDIKPISLTPEILEKNGFTKSIPPPGIHAKCYDLNNKKEKYHLTIANYNKYKRLLLDVDSEDSECFNIKCDYVHELQHALRLCGIKKEIEL